MENRTGGHNFWGEIVSSFRVNCWTYFLYIFIQKCSLLIIWERIHANIVWSIILSKRKLLISCWDTTVQNTLLLTCCATSCQFPAPGLLYARRIDQTLCVVWKTVLLETHTQVEHIGWNIENMSEVSLLIRKQEKKMTEVLVKKTHFTHVEVERLFQIYR